MKSLSIRSRGAARHRRQTALGAVALSIALLSASCASNDDEVDADRPAGDTAAEVQAAEEVVRSATEVTEILITEPLESKPTEGETYVYLTTGDPSAKLQEGFLREALDEVGWNLEVLPVDLNNPATWVDALKQALTLDPKPKVVQFTAQPEAVWGSVIPAYEEAGVGLIPTVVGPQEVEGPVIANSAGPVYIRRMHEVLANWFIADSEGEGKALKYEVNELPVLEIGNDAFRDTVEEKCSACSVEQLVGSIAQAASGEGVPAMVSALQADPSIKYLITDYSAWFAGIRSALDAAGLDYVKVASTSALETTMADIKEGLQQASTLQNNEYATWAAVDAALRFAAGQDISQEEHEGIPVRLITTDSDFAIPEEPSPSDFQEQFKELWNVG